MDGKDGDEEVFEIVDFTTASEWEVFTAKIEEAMLEWRVCGDRPLGPALASNTLGTAQWRKESMIINYSDFPFEWSFHSAIPSDSPPEEAAEEEDEEWGALPATMAPVHDTQNCFPSKAHCIARWYGVREFLLAAPASSSVSVTQSKARLILSALTLAAGNVNCQVAVLVQVLRPSDRLYLGTITAPGLRAEMDGVHLKMPAPMDCHDCDGLVKLLAGKLHTSNLSPLCSVRFTYMLTEWPEEACWTQQPPDLDLDLGMRGDLGYSGLRELPFGLLYDPIKELQLSCSWPRLPPHSFQDSCTGSSLDPCSAPHWSARLLPPAGRDEGRHLPGLLGEHLTEVAAAARDTRTVKELLGPAYQQHAEDDRMSTAFDRLTEHSVPSLGSVILGRRRHKRQQQQATRARGPLSEEVLVPLLDVLFPEPSSPAQYTDSSDQHAMELENGQEHPLKDVCARLKTCPLDSLCWRLSVLCCHCLHSLGGLPALAHLQQELLLEARFRWDNCLVLAGVVGGPDLSSCLLQQKLQLLNCCIQHRATREAGLAAEVDGPEGVDDGDEFFDCVSDEEQENTDDKMGCAWDAPEGRLRACGRLRLLESNRRLYVPLTQDPHPLTEDTLQQQEELLLTLGDSCEGSEQRARLLSSALLSDMEAFKAANPGCSLGDFVRWYSPRDWLEKQGKLSDRMTIAGNLWQEVWSSAHPVPARRQKRLFDEARCAEQALQWLADLSPAALLQELLPVLLQAAAFTVAGQPTLYTLPAAALGALPGGADLPTLQHSDGLAALLALVTQRLARLSRQPCDVNRYCEIIEQLMAIEKCIGRALSLRHKLLPNVITEDNNIKRRRKNGSDTSPSTSSRVATSYNSMDASESVNSGSDTSALVSLISDLLSSGEVTVEGAAKGVAGQAILRLFDRALQHDEYPMTAHRRSSPSSRRSVAECTRTRLGFVGAREYIVRVRAEYPGKTSRLMPHRLYATFLNNDTRIAGLFTKDTTFT